MIPETLRAQIQAMLENIKQQGVPTKHKFYPGAKHGWTIKGDSTDPKQATDAADAFSEMVSWLKTHAG